MVIIGLDEVYVDPRKRYYNKENKKVVTSPYIEKEEDQKSNKVVDSNIINLLSRI